MRGWAEPRKPGPLGSVYTLDLLLRSLGSLALWQGLFLVYRIARPRLCGERHAVCGADHERAWAMPRPGYPQRHGGRQRTLRRQHDGVESRPVPGSSPNQHQPTRDICVWRPGERVASEMRLTPVLDGLETVPELQPMQG